MTGRVEWPLHSAARHGDAGMVAALLRQGADVNKRDRQGDTPLHSSVAAGHNRPDRIGVAKLLLTWGADPNLENKWGDTPLMLAGLKKPHTAMILLLLSEGANPNTRHQAKYGGYTPLHASAYHGDADAVESLLLHGADVNAKTARG